MGGLPFTGYGPPIPTNERPVFVGRIMQQSAGVVECEMARFELNTGALDEEYDCWTVGHRIGIVGE